MFNEGIDTRMLFYDSKKDIRVLEEHKRLGGILGVVSADYLKEFYNFYAKIRILNWIDKYDDSKYVAIREKIVSDKVNELKKKNPNVDCTVSTTDLLDKDFAYSIKEFFPNLYVAMKNTSSGQKKYKNIYETTFEVVNKFINLCFDENIISDSMNYLDLYEEKLKKLFEEFNNEFNVSLKDRGEDIDIEQDDVLDEDYYFTIP